MSFSRESSFFTVTDIRSRVRRNIGLRRFAEGVFPVGIAKTSGYTSHPGHPWFPIFSIPPIGPPRLRSCPAGEPKMRNVARRKASSCIQPFCGQKSSMSPITWRRIKLVSGDPLSGLPPSALRLVDQIHRAGEMHPEKFLKFAASRRFVDAPVQLLGMISTPRTFPDPFCQTGRVPKRYRISATSSPLERMVGLAHRIRPTLSG